MGSRRKNIFALSMAVILATVACDAWLNIRGRVVDERGLPIRGAAIVVQQGKSVVGEHLTDSEGKIAILDSVCPMIGCSSKITISVSKDGYIPVTREFDGKDPNAMRQNDLLIVLVRN